MFTDVFGVGILEEPSEPHVLHRMVTGIYTDLDQSTSHTRTESPLQQNKFKLFEGEQGVAIKQRLQPRRGSWKNTIREIW